MPCLSGNGLFFLGKRSIECENVQRLTENVTGHKKAKKTQKSGLAMLIEENGEVTAQISFVKSGMFFRE